MENKMEKRVVYKKSKVALLRFRGKIATLLLLFILFIPLFTSLVFFRPHWILGAFDNFGANRFSFAFPNFNTSSIFDNRLGNNFDFSTVNPNLKRDVPINFDDIGKVKPNDQPKNVGEGINKLFPFEVNQPFNTKLIIRNQPEDAVANTFLKIKSSYDVTYSGKTATIFVTRTDPRLAEENAIAISYPIALRLGLIINSPTTIDVVGVLRK